MRLSLLVLLLAACGTTLAQDRPTLTVYTYESFAADWGPGPAVEAAFEAQCACDLELIAVDDGVALLGRLRLEGDDTRADVVLGLDTNLMAEATATGLFADHGVDIPDLALPTAWTDTVFLPYDYGHFAFVYDSETLATPPASLAELLDDPDGPTVIIQDPRTSTPGQGLMLWMQSVYGEDSAEAWARLAPRVLTVTKGWSEAYGLFIEGEAPLVLSYVTSPAYHLINEATDRYRAAIFPEGHYMQVEVAARLAASDQPELATDFLRFMLSPEFQTHIPTGNWMMPAIDLGDALPPEFAGLPQPARSILMDPQTVAQSRKAWIDQWLEAMSR